MSHSIFNNNSNDNLQVSLTAIDIDSNELRSSPKAQFGKLVYEASKDLDKVKISFSFVKKEMIVKVDLSTQVSTICLLTCGLTLGGTILDCYKKNKGNWQGFKDCLEGQGHSLGMTTLSCAINCF